MKFILRIIIPVLKLVGLQKSLNVFLQNLMLVRRLEICILKLIKKFIFRNLIDQLNSNFAFSLFLWCRIHSKKTIELQQLIWKLQNSVLQCFHNRQKFQGQVTVYPLTHSDSPSTPSSSPVVFIWHHSGQVRERVTNCYVRYLQAEPLIGLSRDSHGRSYVVSNGSSTAEKFYHLYVLETSRENENTIVSC